MLLTRDNRSDITTCSKSDEINRLLQLVQQTCRKSLMYFYIFLLYYCKRPLGNQMLLDLKGYRFQIRLNNNNDNNNNNNNNNVKSAASLLSDLRQTCPQETFLSCHNKFQQVCCWETIRKCELREKSYEMDDSGFTFSFKAILNHRGETIVSIL